MQKNPHLADRPHPPARGPLPASQPEHMSTAPTENSQQRRRMQIAPLVIDDSEQNSQSYDRVSSLKNSQQLEGAPQHDPSKQNEANTAVSSFCSPRSLMTPTTQDTQQEQRFFSGRARRPIFEEGGQAQAPRPKRRGRSRQFQWTCTNVLQHPIFLVTTLVIFFLLVLLGVIIFMRTMVYIHEAEQNKFMLDEIKQNSMDAGRKGSQSEVSNALSNKQHYHLRSFVHDSQMQGHDANHSNGQSDLMKSPPND